MLWGRLFESLNVPDVDVRSVLRLLSTDCPIETRYISLEEIHQILQKHQRGQWKLDGIPATIALLTERANWCKVASLLNKRKVTLADVALKGIDLSSLEHTLNNWSFSQRLDLAESHPEIFLGLTLITPVVLSN